MEADLQQLRAALDLMSNLSDTEWQLFASIWQPFSARRKEMLTRTGEVEKYLYFVTEGVQRIYFVNEKGNEATLVFTYAPSFGGVLNSMMTETRSSYTYETLTSSSFLRASVKDLKRIMEQEPAINMMVVQGISNALGGLLERLAELQLMSSEEKFRKLLTRSPHILQLIPHKYLASYLGIDVTNFSKLLNRTLI
ncbi:Crp/Fnr family transcriptional regulator [Pedobacter sp. ASV28]|uniref:Crp/Fnr family transcriptional regulator n=1 Tax=Pedobacter sp. ASV28 TaxID=2795123 RepID=UPI0018EC3262|nr:Crp/Fnr family transcriptional regulator [Pedobacter sp. ASV28]